MKQTEKWCPMARLPVSEAGATANRFAPGTGQSDNWRHVKCIGGACAVFVPFTTSDDPDQGRCGLISK